MDELAIVGPPPTKKHRICYLQMDESRKTINYVSLPQELLGHIASYLSFKEIMKTSLCCKRTYVAAKEAAKSYYERLSQELFPESMLPTREDEANLWLRTMFLEIRKKRKIAVDTGVGHTICVQNGNVYAFGEGAFGSLGLGDSLEARESPTKLDLAKFAPENSLLACKGEKICSTSCGSFHSALRTNFGKVYTFGEDDSFRLGYRAGGRQCVPRLIPMTESIPVAEISMGSNHGLLRTVDGAVYTFGKSNNGALGLGPKKIASSRPRILKNLKGVRCISISAGESHSMIISDNGELFTFGNGKFGRLGHGNEDKVMEPKCVQAFVTKNRKICHVSAGGNFSLVLDDAGIVYAFGRVTYGNPVQGGVTGILLPQSIDFFINNQIKIVDCVAANTHSVLLSAAGTVYTMGSNKYGKLGVGDEVDRPFPVKICITEPTSFVESFIAIAAGDWHTILVSERNTVYTVGGGWFGRLGHGNQQNLFFPKEVQGLL